MNAPAPLAVRCEECGADPGEPCMTPANKARPAHRVRLQTAAAADEPRPSKRKGT